MLSPPYLDVAVATNSTAAQGESPPPITRMTSTLIVSTFNAAATRVKMALWKDYRVVVAADVEVLAYDRRVKVVREIGVEDI